MNPVCIHPSQQCVHDNGAYLDQPSPRGLTLDVPGSVGRWGETFQSHFFFWGGGGGLGEGLDSRRGDVPLSLNSSLSFGNPSCHCYDCVWLSLCVYVRAWCTCTSSSRHDLLMRQYWLSPVLKTQFLSLSLAAQSAECRLEIFSLPESRRCNAEVSVPFFFLPLHTSPSQFHRVLLKTKKHVHHYSPWWDLSK